jgi:hypothetical protein
MKLLGVRRIEAVHERPVIEPDRVDHERIALSGAWASAAPLQAARATPARIPTNRVVRANDPLIDFNVKREHWPLLPYPQGDPVAAFTGLCGWQLSAPLPQVWLLTMNC